MPPRSPFAPHKAAPATGERQQHAGTGKIKTYATLHTRENASSFFNEASTLVTGDSVKDKESLLRWPLAFNRLALSIHIARGAIIGVHDLFGKPVSAFRSQRKAGSSLLLPSSSRALVVFVVSAVMTFSNIGVRAHFVPHQLKAFTTG